MADVIMTFRYLNEVQVRPSKVLMRVGIIGAGNNMTMHIDYNPQKGIRWNADVNAAWNILVKNNDNVSSNLDRNEVERFVVDPVVLIPSGFNRG